MLIEGTKVKLSRDVAYEPYTRLLRGETGTVVEAIEDLGAVEVRMDRYHEGLDIWHNKAHFYGPDVGALEPVEEPSFLSRNGTRLGRYALAAAIAFFAIVGGWEMVCGDDVYPHAQAHHYYGGANTSHGQPQEAAGRSTENRSAGAN